MTPTLTDERPPEVKHGRVFMEQTDEGDLVFGISNTRDVFVLISNDIVNSIAEKDHLWKRKTVVPLEGILLALAVRKGDRPGFFALVNWMDTDKKTSLVNLVHYNFTDQHKVKEVSKMTISNIVLNPSLTVLKGMILLSYNDGISLEDHIFGIPSTDKNATLVKIDIGIEPRRVINMIWMDSASQRFAILKQDPYIIDDNYEIEFYRNSGWIYVFL